MEDDKPPSKIMVVRSGCGASGRPDNIQFWIALEKLVLRRKSSLQCCMDTRRTYTRNDGAMVCHIICSFKAAILALAGATVAPAAGRPKGFCWVTHTKKTLKQHQMAKTHRKSKRTHKSNEFGFLQWQICWVFDLSNCAQTPPFRHLPQALQHDFLGLISSLACMSTFRCVACGQKRLLRNLPPHLTQANA